MIVTVLGRRRMASREMAWGCRRRRPRLGILLVLGRMLTTAKLLAALLGLIKAPLMPPTRGRMRRQKRTLLAMMNAMTCRMLTLREASAVNTDGIMSHADEVIDMERAAADFHVASLCPATMVRTRLRYCARLAAVHNEGGLHILSRYVIVLKGITGMVDILGVPGHEMLPVTNAQYLRHNPTGIYPLGLASISVAASREDGMTPLLGKLLKSLSLMLTVATTALSPLSLEITMLREREGPWGRGVLTLPPRVLLIRTGITATSDTARPPGCSWGSSPRPRRAATEAAMRRARHSGVAAIATWSVVLGRIHAAAACKQRRRSRTHSG